jgi:hypothetical protein
MARFQYDVAVRAVGLSHTDNMKNGLLDWSQLTDVKNATYEVHPTTRIEKAEFVIHPSLFRKFHSATERSAEHWIIRFQTDVKYLSRHPFEHSAFLKAF